MIATLFIGGWHFSPALDASGKCIGTKIFNLSSADAGGSIPAGLQNTVAPTQARKVADNLIALVRKQKGEGAALEFIKTLPEGELPALADQLKK